MSNSVDPFTQPIPDFFINADDQELRSWAEYLNRFLHDLWIRTGGATDLISDSSSASEIKDFSVAQLRGQVESLRRSIDSLKLNQELSVTPVDMSGFKSAVISSAYTALDRDFLVIETSDTISLPLRPPENAVIIAINGHRNGISISGNGKLINDSTSISSRVKNTQMTFKYNLAKDRWYMSVSQAEDTEHKIKIEAWLESITKLLERQLFTQCESLNFDYSEIKKQDFGD